MYMKDGHSVLAHIHDFDPYFYVPTPRGFEESDISAFIDYLNVSSCGQPISSANIIASRSNLTFRANLKEILSNVSKLSRRGV